MRVFRALAPLVCLAALVFSPTFSPSGLDQSRAAQTGGRPGPRHLLVAKPGNAHYSYGMSHPQRMALTANLAPSATFEVTYIGFGAFPQAQTAFQAAVDIWSQTIVSPVPIRVEARFEPLVGDVLGSAGPTRVCQSPSGAANTEYAAALADALNGSRSCATSNFEIEASFNSNFTDWDFGTSGTPVVNEYNFMTVVLHELGHGLGFYGSMTAEPNGSIGRFTSPPDIYDRFAITGDGTLLLGFTNPSSALGAQLISDNTFWNGPRAIANHGSTPKLETHDFTVWGEPTAFRNGSSYSHVDEDLYSLTPNGLMTWALEASEVYTDPGPIVRGMLQDEGWTILAAPCAYDLVSSTASVGAVGGSDSVALTAGASSTCPWSVVNNSPSMITVTSATSGTGSANISYTVAANPGASQRTGTLTIQGRTFTVTQNGTGPTMTLDRDTLVFGAATNGAAFVTKTTAQVVRLTQSGAGTVTWTATSNRPWLTVTPASGSGTATLTTSVNFVNGLANAQSGAITLTFTGAGNAPGPVGVTLNVRQNGTTVVPFGSFDSPASNSTGVTGSIGLTGWALDDVEVIRVRILRDPVTGESPGSLVPIGTAVLVDGARPDVGVTYAAYPRFSRAGWGYLMLTNMLPNQGNGTFTFYAYADDPDGHSRLLGTKTMTCANSTATAPFGAIDRPDQGEVVSGIVSNFGWVLARGAVHADPPGGGTVTAFIDSVPVGTPTGWTNRSDLSTLFPTGYSDLTSTLAVLGFDSTALSNGTHTIQWGVTATNSQSAGIGSRYFTVSNGASSVVAGVRASSRKGGRSLVVEQAGPNAPAALTAAIGAAPVSRTPVAGRIGWNQDAPYRTYTANAKGSVVVDAEELGLFQLRLQIAAGGGTYAGYLRAGDALGPLPVGSRLDPDTGAFGWQPGVGFTGPYDFVFTQCQANAAGTSASGCIRQDVRVVLHPKGSNRVGPQITIDAPAADARVPGRFVVAGWAIDLDDTVATGVDALHVWAYPRSSCGRGAPCNVPPIFLGAAAYGGKRPDVGAIYGDRFSASGYGLVVDRLERGSYDIAVFAWSTARGGFVPAKTVRVVVP